jgi:hypothetical protein
MALKEIRATLDLDSTFTFTDSASNIRLAYNKRINLTEFKRHTVQTIQVFHNTFDLNNITGADVGEIIRHTFVSTYPLSFSFESDTIATRVPNASDENVHYRCTEAFSVQQNNIQQSIYKEEWPEKELAGFTNLSFYTPQLYLTILYEVPGFNDSDFFLADPSISLYCVVDEVDCGNVEYAMGCVAEREGAMYAQLEATGTVIPNSFNTLALETFPLYNFARREQGMMRLDAFGVDTDFFFRINNLGSEEMLDPAAIRSAADSARTMVDFNDAFGATRLGTFYPDWVAEIVGNMRGGNERVSTQVIPKRFNDDGTTRMFTP